MNFISLFHNPILNAKLAYTMEITAFLLRDFLRKVPSLVLFFAIFCEADTHYFFAESGCEGFFWAKQQSTVIKDCPSGGCLERVSPETAEVMAVLNECHQRLPEQWLSWKSVIKDCRSDVCLERVSAKTAQLMSVLKDCHQRQDCTWKSFKKC